MYGRLERGVLRGVRQHTERGGAAAAFQDAVPTPLARLNLARAVESVARTSASADLEPTVLLLLKDPNFAVCLWGMKAAKPTVSALRSKAGSFATSGLPAAIVASVRDHPKNGYIAEAAYDALIPVAVGASAAPDGAPVMKPMLDIVAFRAGLYTTSVPDLPSAEYSIGRFFYRNYTAALPPTQTQINQELLDLIFCSSQQAPSASKSDLVQIVQMLRYTGGALQVIWGSVSGPAPEATTNVLKGFSSMSPGTAPTTIQARGQTLFPRWTSWAFRSSRRRP